MQNTRLNSILELKKVLLLAENQLKIGAIGSTLEHEPKEPPKLKAFQNWKPTQEFNKEISHTLAT